MFTAKNLEYAWKSHLDVIRAKLLSFGYVHNF